MKHVLGCIALLASVSVVLAQEQPAPAPAPAPAAAPTAEIKPAALAPATAVDPNKVILEVGTEKMTVAEFNSFIEALPAEIQPMARGAGKRMLAEKMIDIKLLAAEARRMGLDKDPKVALTLKLAEEQTLAQAMAEKASKPDDAALKAEYDKDPSKFEQLKVRHILVRSSDSPAPPTPGKKDLSDAEAKAKASELRDKIVNKKEDFAAVAKADSDDTSSGRQGGELGSIDRTVQFVPEFKDAAFKLKTGEVSEPVKSTYGYHIIQVEERKTPTFDEVKSQLAGQQGGAQVDATLKKLRAAQPATLDEAYFGPATSKPAGHP